MLFSFVVLVSLWYDCLLNLQATDYNFIVVTTLFPNLIPIIDILLETTISILKG